jgi:four helix bundle protein
LVKKLPKSEQFGLISQIKRAVVSIPANIAEGAARQTRRELLQYLCIARGSLSEVDTYLEIIRRLGYLREEELEEIEKKMTLVDKMLAGLITSLKKSSPHPSPLTAHGEL